MGHSGKQKLKAKEKSKGKKNKAQIAADTVEDFARSDLSKIVLHAYENEYADKTSLWEQIERKAQGTIAIAAIMLAACLAFAPQSDASAGSLQLILFAGALATLLFSIWLGVKSLRVETSDVPPRADDVRQLADEALRFPEKSKLPALVNGLRYDLLDIWSACNQALGEKHDQKAALVGRSQSAILASALLMAIATGLQVWGTNPQAVQGAMNGEMRDSGLSESTGTNVNRVPRPRATRQEPINAGRTDWGAEPRPGGGPGGKEQHRLSAAESFRPVR